MQIKLYRGNIRRRHSAFTKDKSGYTSAGFAIFLGMLDIPCIKVKHKMLAICFWYTFQRKVFQNIFEVWALHK